MAVLKETKTIIITSNGYVYTSRGRCRTPLKSPYIENCDAILKMIARDNATIYEVLPNGKYVKLTVQNFATDNSEADGVNHSEAVQTAKSAGTPKEETVEVAPVVEEKHDEPKRNMTRRERRELERKEREESQKHKKEEPTVPVEEVTETAEVPVESIEE